MEHGPFRHKGSENRNVTCYITVTPEFNKDPDYFMEVVVNRSTGAPITSERHKLGK